VASYLIDQAKVSYYSVSIKFGRTIKISSLKNENFKLYKNSSTPELVSSPFQVINTIKDYNQISRIITLYWRISLDDQQEYYIDLVNLLDAAGAVVPSEKVAFTYISAATPTTSVFSEPELQPVLIEDKSIKTNIDVSYQVLAKNPKFYISDIDPNNGDFYLTNDYGDGRVTITFNERPASNFLNSKYFQAQRKKIQKAPARWETLETEISMHSWKPEVYLDFPSLDATPSFNTSGKDYFEKGYKYRIIASKDIGI
jgi:hypothetical protein